MNLQDTSVFQPHSPQAQAIVRLFYFDLIISLVIFAVVAGLILYAIMRFRHRPGAPEPRQDAGNVKLETVWTIIPILIVASLLVGTAHTMSIVNPPVRQRKADVLIIAHQWWWEYQYPKSGVLTANELHLPMDQNWLVEVRSADVIHDFWVPDLAAKMDAVPGHPNYLWINPRKSGTFLGACAEFCGNQHALMGILVMVQPPEDFARWEQSQLQVPPTPSSGSTANGAQLFQERTCQNCHAIAGTKAVARVGPDLTHLGDRQTLAAGVLTNTTANLTIWIKDPQRYKPGCYMPNLHLAETEAQQVAEYLEGGKR